MASMPSIPLDIIYFILHILADEEDHRSLKACSLASHAFLHPCRKHIFRSIVINREPYRIYPHSTMRMLGDLLARAPEIASYVRQLHFEHILSEDLADPNVPQVLIYFTQLQSLSLYGYMNRDRGQSRSLDWIAIALPIRTAFLRLMHLPTLTHLGLRFIKNFTVYDLIPCTNLLRLKVSWFHIADIHDTPEPWSILSSRPVQLQRFDIGYGCSGVANKLVDATRSDGLRVVDFKDLKVFEASCENLFDIASMKLPLKMAERLTAISLMISTQMTFSGFAEMVAPFRKTLTKANLRVTIEDGYDDPLAGICEELGKMAGRQSNVLEDLEIQVKVALDCNCETGDEWGRLDQVLTKPGWPALQDVSLQITIYSYRRNDNTLLRTLKNLPQTQFTGLSSSTTTSFHFDVKEIHLQQ
ncbi:hypothetical protein BDZ97DRAFT_450582 [Flammula alnicola]|nr:hypothetical protein BDZ97DRAFT_450582 [Flammula alnicola]